MTARIETPSWTRTSRTYLGRLTLAAALAMLAASLVDLGLYAVAGRIFPEVTGWPGAGPMQIIGANFVYLFIGATVFAVLRWLSSRPVRLYLIFATIGLVLSLGLPISAGFGYGPPGTPPAGTATVVTLSLMHIISYLICVPVFIRLTRDQTVSSQSN